GRLRNGALGVSVPARIPVACDALTHLEHREHSTHINVTERALSPTHGNAVAWGAHLHHLPHPVLAHEHCPGHDAIHLLLEAGGVHRQHVWYAMPHLVHHEVGDMVVQSAVAGIIRFELDVPRRSYRHHDGSLRKLGRSGGRAAIRTNDPEAVAVEMDRVGIHTAEIPDTDPNALPASNYERVRAGEHSAIESQKVEVRHHRGIRCRGAGLHEPLREHDCEIAAHAGFLRPPRMDNEEAHHSHGHLHHLVKVRVVHLRAMLA